MTRRRLPPRLLPLAAVTLLILAALAAGLGAIRGPHPNAVPTAQQVNERTMSPFCTGLTLAACPSSQAAELRTTLAAMVAQGKTNRQIDAWLLANYPATVVGAPRNPLAWMVPAAAVLAGLAVVGAFGLLAVTGNSLNMMSMIGLILLTGLVGKNAILLVDFTNTLRKRGLGRNEALLQAGPTSGVSPRGARIDGRFPDGSDFLMGLLSVLGALALAGLALWILGPLRAPLQRRSAVDDARWKELVDAKHAIYRSILDLEFDRAVGKVSEADYTFLRRQHESDALALLKEMDALAGGPPDQRGGPGPSRCR
ncbi:MAG: hypothetical protein NVSMB32_04240 [Actinomycetota bacterium]